MASDSIPNPGLWGVPVPFGAVGDLRRWHWVSFIAYWKGHTPVGKTVYDRLSGIAILPALADITKAPLPKNRTLDGSSGANGLLGKPGKRPHPELEPTCSTWPLIRANVLRDHPDKARQLKTLLDTFPRAAEN
ncbi:hypothetical protein GCM10027299_08370 [Larkinella ripae]